MTIFREKNKTTHNLSAANMHANAAGRRTHKSHQRQAAARAHKQMWRKPNPIRERVFRSNYPGHISQET